MRRCWRISCLTQPPQKKKKEKSIALAKASWLGVSAHYYRFLSPMQAARQGDEVCPTPRGYLTNLFDVADPDTELPPLFGSRGNTAPLLLLIGRASVSVHRRCSALRSGWMTPNSRIRAAVPSSHTPTAPWLL